MKTGLKSRRAKRICLVFGAVALLLCVSCAMSDDLDEAISRPYTAIILKAQLDADGLLYFVGDDGVTTYQPASDLALPDSVIGRRCYLGYSYRCEGTRCQYEADLCLMRVVRLQPVVFEPIAGMDDDVDRVTAWISGRYLNVVASFYGSTGGAHDFALQCDTAHLDSDRVVVCELQHAARNNMSSAYLLDVVSFDLWPLVEHWPDICCLKINYITHNEEAKPCFVQVDLDKIRASVLASND